MALNAARYGLFFVHIFISPLLTPDILLTTWHSSVHVILYVKQSELLEIKVQNIQGTCGSEWRWNVFLKTHPYKIYKMDLRSWESLWKVLVVIGVGNIFLFFIIIVFVFTISNSILLWILIGIESGCYLGVLIARRRIRQLLR
jgi:hypothetical protein